MDWKEFTSIPNGTQVLNHGYDQCVALANLYNESVVGAAFVPVASAYQWWTDFYGYEQLTSNYTQSQTPVPGAIFVARGGIYDLPNGHIGVVTEVRAGGFVAMEQNTGLYEPQRYVYRHFRIKDSSVYGFLVPKKNPADQKPEEELQLDESVNNKMFMIYKEAAKGNPRTFAIVAPGFFMEMEKQSQATLNNLNKQISGSGAPSLPVSEDLWNSFKRAALKGTNK